MNEFFTWSTLATFAGCATATAVITQFIKNLKGIKNVATQWISYGIALVLLFAATYFTGGLTGPTVALIPFNAILIALAANGAYAAITRVNQTATANDADGDIPVGAASGGVTVEQQDVTPAAEAQTGTALSGDLTLNDIDTQITAVQKAISDAAPTDNLDTLNKALTALQAVRAVYTVNHPSESGAVASGTTGAV